LSIPVLAGRILYYRESQEPDPVKRDGLVKRERLLLVRFASSPDQTQPPGAILTGLR